MSKILSSLSVKVFFGTKTRGALPLFSPKFCLGWLRRPLLRRLCIFIAETFTDNPQRRFPSKTLPIWVKTCHLTNFSVTLKEFNTSLHSLNYPPHRDWSSNVLLLSRSSSGKCYCGCSLFRLENLDNWEKHWALTQNLYVYLYSYIYLYLFCQSKWVENYLSS